MTEQAKGSKWKWWIACGSLSVSVMLAGFFITRGFTQKVTAREAEATSETAEPIRVTVTTPQKGGMDRTTVQAGSVQPFETVQLFSRVPGYLESQSVDIGDSVEKDQVLARIAVPELVKQVERNKAALAQANARIAQMNSHVVTAVEDKKAAEAALKQTEAAKKSAEAWLRFRDKQLQRMKELFALKSIDERLVDETQERFEAATESTFAAIAMIDAARAKLGAADAKILQTKADVLEAEAEVSVTKSELEKSEEIVKFATIKAPFKGVVTQRSLFPGGFVRPADSGANIPLLTVEKTDLMRVVVYIPDRDVPLATPGKRAEILIDALPGKKFSGKISRVARSEDSQTRMMRAEIDVRNTDGLLCNGMYGQVIIFLEQSSRLTVPSGCLLGKTEDGTGTVYVVRDKHARLISVKLGADNGLRVGILEGLKDTDKVILHPPSGLRDGSKVAATEGEHEEKDPSGH